MNDKELHNTLKDIKSRLEKIENVVFKNKKVKKEKDSDYTGLSGGIRLIIDNKFLNKPKDVSEIVSEMKRENFHYPKESIRKMLSADFTKKKRILTRIKEGKVFKYVIRR